MARIQFPHMSSVLTASFSVRQQPNAPFVLSCPPDEPRLPCGCRRRCTGFPSASSWPCPSGDRSAPSVPERAFHRSRPHSGKFLSDKVFLLFLLSKRTASFYKRCLYSVRLAVVPVFGTRLVRISSDLFRFDPKQFLMYLQINFLSFFIILLGRKINIPVSHAFITFIFNTV